MDKPLPNPIQMEPMQGLRPQAKVGDVLPAIHLVRTSWIVRLIGKYTFAILALSIVAMFALPWQQTSRGQGTVVAFNPQQRPQVVGSQQDGIVKSVRPNLREGSLVKKDQPILDIEPFSPDEVNLTLSQINNLKTKLEGHKTLVTVYEGIIEQSTLLGESNVASAKQKVAAAAQKWEQAKQEVQGLNSELTQKTYEWQQAQALYPKGLTSELDFNDKRTNWQLAQAKLLQGQAKVNEAFNSLTGEENELEAKRKEADIKIEESRAKAQDERQKLQTTEKELGELNVKLGSVGRGLTISSPVDGILHEIYGMEGSRTVKKGDSLFTVVPQATEMSVLLSVIGRDMPLVHVGDKVRLQFEGWPAVQFVGWPSVAVGTFGGKIASLSPTDDTKGNFSVLVVPDPEEPAWPDNRYLRQGVRASGWILLKRVSLGYEIWRQLNGFPPIISDQEPDKAKEKSDKDGKKIKLPKAM